MQFTNPVGMFLIHACLIMASLHLGMPWNHASSMPTKALQELFSSRANLMALSLYLIQLHEGKLASLLLHLVHLAIAGLFRRA